MSLTEKQRAVIERTRAASAEKHRSASSTGGFVASSTVPTADELAAMSFKRLSWAYGTAKAASERERVLGLELIRRAREES